MVPPGIHYYFYTFNGSYVVNSILPLVAADDEMIDKIKSILGVKNRDSETNFDLDRLNFIDG